MRLKRSCCFQNATLGATKGSTPDWGQEFGQGADYFLKEEGCSKISNALIYYKKEQHPNFSYGKIGKTYEEEKIISVITNVQIEVYDPKSGRGCDIYPINAPLILALVKDNEDAEHTGRRTLKMNIGFSYDTLKNQDFYEEINGIIPSPWFGIKLHYESKKTGMLTLTIIKAPKPNPIPGSTAAYQTKTDRTEIWEALVQSYDKNSISSGAMYQTNKIFYGAPGTGKSHKVKELLKGKEKTTQRTTFHPEYDYSSFIGGYKPITEIEKISGKEVIKYKFVPQIFINMYVKAWNDVGTEYYLVIEEINRGNCAEIFGDIFQLLDRNPEDEITPAIELKEYLGKKLTTENGVKGISNGKMTWPPNLTIFATMNTSDQSLFPMDSAFKRRWDWEYIPINYDESPENLSSMFKVRISDTECFSWLDFIKKVNDHIKQNPNLGMDKCIGNYFIKAKGNIITMSDFINKVVFYLWDDVFKDENNGIFEENTFYEDFFPIDENSEKKIEAILNNIGVKIETIE
jgi:hypothetical protein